MHGHVQAGSLRNKALVSLSLSFHFPSHQPSLGLGTSSLDARGGVWVSPHLRPPPPLLAIWHRVARLHSQIIAWCMLPLVQMPEQNSRSLSWRPRSSSACSSLPFCSYHCAALETRLPVSSQGVPIGPQFHLARAKFTFCPERPCLASPARLPQSFCSL